MKALTVLFAMTTIGLGVVCFVQRQALNERQARITALDVETEHQTAQLQELEAKQVRAEEQRREMVRYADEVGSQLIARTVEASNAMVQASAPHHMAANNSEATEDKDGGGFGKMLGKMMKDPAMKKMIQTQQRQMMDQLYSPLIKTMSLTPEEADNFKGLLADNAMKATEAASSLFGNAGSTNQAQLASTMAEQQKDSDARIKELLGDTRYAQYKDYQETVGERTQLNAFKQQLAGSDNGLSDQQTEQLLSFMKEEKKSAAAAGKAVTGNGHDADNLQAMLSGEQTDKLLQTQEDVNARVFDRARTVLSPGQLDSFGQFQTNQLQMMRLGMTMAKKMFAPGKTAEGE